MSIGKALIENEKSFSVGSPLVLTIAKPSVNNWLKA